MRCWADGRPAGAPRLGLAASPRERNGFGLENGGEPGRGLGDGQGPVVTAISRVLSGLSLPVRWAVVGTASAGVIGGAIGLVVGLFTYLPTAPFAAVELGLPSAIVGGFAGLMAGAVAWAARRMLRNDR